MDFTHVVDRVPGTVFTPRETLCGETSGTNLFLIYSDVPASQVWGGPPRCPSCTEVLGARD